MSARIGSVISVAFALIAFAVALLAGTAVENTGVPVVTRAIFAMLACYLVGRVISAIAEIAIRDHVARYRAAHPVPEIDDLDRPVAAQSNEDVEVLEDEPQAFGEASEAAQAAEAA
ncbi:MAG: hypothetical protein AAGG07_02110 [Planctomycetota bacterium]